MGRRKVVCVAADRSIGVEGGTTADCVDVVFVQAVPEVRFTLSIQMPKDQENRRVPVTPAMRRCFR